MTPIPKLIETQLDQFQRDEVFDLIVIGSGAAGFSAALSGLVNGAKVLLIEKTAYVGGTTALSAATSWIPLTKKGLAVNPDDTKERVKTFLDNAVGLNADPELRDAFIKAGPSVVDLLETHTALQFQVRQLHPDYLSELDGSVLRGRAIEPRPFDGKLLGPNLKLIRPPIPEFTVLGGMMVDRDDIFHLLRLTQTAKSFIYSLKIISRHLVDIIFRPRSTRLVMGNAMIARMLFSFIEKGGKLLTNAEVTEILSEDAKVCGVSIKQTLANESTRYCKLMSKAGVVLASGGFNRNPTKRVELLEGIKQEWCPGAPGHTGSAQDLALKIGAKLGVGGLTHAFWAPVSTRKREDQSIAAFPHFVMDRGKPGMLAIDSKGNRFVNESTSYHLFGLAMQAHNKFTPCIPTWLICDAPALKRYGLGMVRPGGKNLDKFIKDGYLKRGGTIAELANQIQVSPITLTKTIESFNTFAETGIDLDFHRGESDYQRANGDASWPGKNPCLGSLLQAPFFAIALYPGDIGASTGLATNVHAQVLNQNDQPILGLYACGNDMHSIMGGTYPAPGITIGPGVTFGFLAANHALDTEIIKETSDDNYDHIRS
jgi:succinate dehydrogenase/fumarate reductase flavoprotein subunit